MTPKQWQHFCYHTMGWRDAAIRQGYETDTDDDDPPTRTYRRVVRERKPDCGVHNCKNKFRLAAAANARRPPALDPLAVRERRASCSTVRVLLIFFFARIAAPPACAPRGVRALRVAAPASRTRGAQSRGACPRPVSCPCGRC